MKRQRYHIDRVACKIYEHRIETDMYCSRSCLLRSASVRAQLPDEPLWLAGNISRRINTTYRIEGPEMDDHEKKNEIEIIRAVEEKLSELKIREGDSSTESEVEDNEESETDVKGFLDEVSSILGADELEKSKPKSENATPKTTPKPSPKSETEPSPKSPNKMPTPATPTGRTSRKASESQYNPRLPDPQMSTDKVTFTEDELQKLARLRSKYSNYGKKKPIIVDPVPASPSSSKEAENEDEEIVDTTKHSPKAVPTTSRVEPRFVENVRILFRSWVTDRTRQLLRSGGLSISGETDSIMKKFFRPYSDDVAELNDFVMPTVDSIDVRKKRLHIFLDSIKKQMTAYQQELDVTFSELNWLYMIAATFDLEPNTITNFPNKVLKLVCASLLKLISLLDTSAEDSIFPQGKVSDKFVRLLGDIEVDMEMFESIISEVVESEEKS
ncbi:hypothetical protein OESDEN_10887 [Oesophagostomum dentatum]|uniref:protein-serine/threonine phosphatase n=1 Tax=Oesophagostomum dentatum TaxID=61180 RepID=A0A0B1T0K3_OESDE|nr:hypothetical protein OESDEN_10887 [Oesophagostomum dentatum]